MNKIVFAYRVRRVLLKSLSVISKVLLAFRGSKLCFRKEPSGRWYIVLPWWPGPKAALEMVQGADTFLDRLSQGANVIAIAVSTQEKSGYEPIIKYLDDHVDGAYYETVTGDKMHRMWLCGVTEYVFGSMPQTIWYKTI